MSNASVIRALLLAGRPPGLSHLSFTMAEEDLTEFWEKAGFHVDIDGDGEDDGDVTSLADLKSQLASAASPVCRGTRIWAEGLDGWLPLGKLMLEIYGPEEGTAHDRISDLHGIAAWQACSYQIERDGGTLGPALTLGQLHDLVVDGSVGDATVVCVEGELREALGAMTRHLDGLIEALLLGAGDAAGDAEVGIRGEQTVEHWATAGYLYKKRPRDPASAELCIGELQELMEQGALTDDTLVWSDGMHDWAGIAALLDAEPELSTAMLQSYPAEVLVDAGTGGEVQQLSIADFRTALRANEVDDDTAVYAEGMEDFAPLHGCRALLGVPLTGGHSDEHHDSMADAMAVSPGALPTTACFCLPGRPLRDRVAPGNACENKNSQRGAEIRARRCGGQGILCK